jgi:amino acid transporter
MAMKALSWILKAVAIFYAIGTFAYMAGGDPNNPPPPGAWILTAIIAAVLFFVAMRIDAKISRDDEKK